MSQPNAQRSLSCPRCGAKNRYDDRHIGRVVKCGRCGQKVQLTEPIGSRLDPPSTLPPHVSPFADRIPWWGRALVYYGVACLLSLVVAVLTFDSQKPNAFTMLAVFLITTPIMVMSMAAYVAPAVIAHRRRHRNFMPIMIVNVAFGWTLAFWILCLAWAYSANVHDA